MTLRSTPEPLDGRPTGRPSCFRGRASRAAALVTAIVALLAPGAASAAAPVEGSAGIGDHLFPSLGNGGYEVDHYALGLRYGGPALEQVDGTAVISGRTRHALSRFDLDFAGDAVRSVSVNGRRAAWRVNAEEIVITPARPLAAHHRLWVGVVYRSGPLGMNTAGPRAAVAGAWFLAPGGSVAAAQPNLAHRIFPANDHPSDKARYDFALDVPTGVTAVANGRLTDRRSHAGRTVWRYSQHRPMASELVQVAVGDLTVIHRRGPHGLPIRDVLPRTKVAAATPGLARTGAQIAWMESRVGPYPFEVYGVLAADAEFPFALETQTLSLFPVSYLAAPADQREPTLVHELAHQWFGDSVAPRRWSDVWLNEGHATWYELLYGQSQGWRILDQTMRTIFAGSDGLRAENGPVARPNSGALDDLFSDNVYSGGALVLYALRQKVGAHVFQRIERAWVRENAGGSAGTTEFIALASRVSGRKLGPFLHAWLYGKVTPAMPGHPEWRKSRSGFAAGARIEPHPLLRR